MMEYESEHVCPVCGQKFRWRHDTGDDMAIDQNPHDHAPFGQMVVCPHCGYVTADIASEVEPKVKRAVYSAEYQKIHDENPADDALYRLVYLADLIANDYIRGLNYQAASWYLAAHERKEEAAKYREKAVESYQKYLADTTPYLYHLALTVADLLRQCGRFDEARQIVSSALFDDVKGFGAKGYKMCMCYELDRIAARDSAEHLYSEVPNL